MSAPSGDRPSSKVWPPEKGATSKSSVKTESVIGEVERGRKNTKSLALSKSENPFVKKIAQEKGIVNPTDGNVAGNRKSQKVKDMMKTFEKPKGSKSGKTPKAKGQQKTNAREMAKKFDTLAGPRRRKNSFSAKNRYTNSLGLKSNNLLATEDRRKLKRLKDRKSNKRGIRPLVKRLSNKRSRPQQPVVVDHPSDSDGEEENNANKAVDKTVVAKTPANGNEVDETDVERDIVKGELKKFAPNTDNTFKNFLARLRPVAQSPVKRRRSNLLKPKQLPMEDLIGIDGELDEDEAIGEEQEQFAKKITEKQPSFKNNLSPKSNTLKRKAKLEKQKKAKTLKRQAKKDKLTKKEVEVEIKELASPVAQKSAEKNEETKSKEVDSPAIGFQEMTIEEAFPDDDNSLPEDLKQSGKEGKTFGLSPPVMLKSFQNESNSSKMLASEFESPGAMMSGRKLFLKQNRGKAESKNSLVNLFADDASLKRYESTTSTNHPGGITALLQMPSTSEVGSSNKLPIGRKFSQGSLDTFKSKANQTVATTFTTKTSQTLSSVLDPLSYVFSAKYRENMEDFQESCMTSVINKLQCCRSVNISDPSSVISNKLRKIKKERDFIKIFGMDPIDATDEIEAFQPLVAYDEGSSHPRNYNAFVILQAARKLGHETRYTNLWLELKRQLTVRLKVQVQNLSSVESSLGKLSALQSAIVAMEDIHRIKAQIRGTFFRPCRQFVMNFLHGMRSGNEMVFVDSTERTTYQVARKLQRRLKKIIAKENRLRRAEVGLILVEGTKWECDLCNQRKGPNSKYQKRLPSCQHVFHKDCIDAWLQDHYICPVCSIAADKKVQRNLKPLSVFLCEFVYYVAFLFPLAGALAGSIIAGLAIAFNSFDDDPKIDIEDRGYLKCVVTSYVLDFSGFGFFVQSFSFLRYYGTKEYNSDVWLLLPPLLSFVWSPFVAFFLSDNFQDPNLFKAEDLLRETWKGFGGLVGAYVGIIILTHLFVKFLLPYFSWCFTNFRLSMMEATCGEKIYAVYFWLFCSPFFFCCLGDEYSEIDEDEEDRMYEAVLQQSPDIEEGFDRDDMMEVYRPQNAFQDDLSETEVNLQTFFAEDTRSEIQLSSSTLADTLKDEFDGETMTNLSHNRHSASLKHLSKKIATDEAAQEMMEENGQSSML